MQRLVYKRWLERTRRGRAWPASSRRSRPAARSRAPRSPATHAAGPVRAGEGRGAACWPASAGSARTPSSCSRWPPTAPSRSARSATTARSPRSRPSGRTSPTTSRRRSPSSPTRRSTASARSSTSPAAPCSARGPRSTSPDAEPRTIETAFPIILGGHHDMAPLSDETTARSPGSTRPTCSRTSGRSSRAAARVLDISCLEAETTEGALERLQARGGQEGARRRRAARALRPHRLRGRAAVPRPAPRAVGDRRRAARVPRRPGRGEPAPAHLDRAALRRDPQRARRLHGARPRRRRRLPVRDDRGHLRRRLRDRHLEPLLRAAQGDREGDLDARHPRGARLRAPVLGDRAEARADRDLRDARLLRLRRRPAPASPSSTPSRRERQRILAGEEDGKPAKTFRFYPKVYKAAIAAANGTHDLRRVLGEGARARASSSRSRCATSWT